MPDGKHCPHCGVPLSADVPGGLCLRCLAQLGVAGPASETGADTTISSDGPQRVAPAGAFGDYELLEEIGHGGMGVVHKARQVRLNRLVALKVIKPGMDSAQVLARFEAERQALALMDHTNIARVFDAGVTPAGRPYFVMELVQGVPITHFCDEHRLTIRERLDLFMAVCHAIQHAHQKGIIHRDIKPSNVLVTLQDGKPVPKVIDFGVSKATGPRLTKDTLATEIGAVIGTLEYMSPEQARLDQFDIDTRSDIYALGILLYELLTGTTPLNCKTLKQGAFEEVLRLIREKEPPRPSTRLTETRETLSAVSEKRNVEPARLPRLLQGDLDWMVMKALEKDRRRRYESATGFAQDIYHYLHDEPVLAGPPAVRYRLSKFVRRHRGAVAVALSFVILMAVATGVSLALAVRANRERARANQAESAASWVNIFLNYTFTGASKQERRGGWLSGNVTVREAIGLAEPEISRTYTKDPIAEASIRDFVGRTYYRLGDYASASLQFERVVALRKVYLGVEDPNTRISIMLLVRSYIRAGRNDEALALAGEKLFKQLLSTSKSSQTNAIRVGP